MLSSSSSLISLCVRAATFANNASSGPDDARPSFEGLFAFRKAIKCRWLVICPTLEGPAEAQPLQEHVNRALDILDSALSYPHINIRQQYISIHESALRGQIAHIDNFYAGVFSAIEQCAWWETDTTISFNLEAELIGRLHELHRGILDFENEITEWPVCTPLVMASPQLADLQGELVRAVERAQHWMPYAKLAVDCLLDHVSKVAGTFRDVDNNAQFMDSSFEALSTLPNQDIDSKFIMSTCQTTQAWLHTVFASPAGLGPFTAAVQTIQDGSTAMLVEKRVVVEEVVMRLELAMLTRSRMMNATSR